MKENNPKKVLLLGGTGVMGAHLAEILSNQGIYVDVTTRRNHKDSGNIHFILGNAHDTAFVSQLLKQGNYDAVVDFMVYTTTEFKSRVEIFLKGTRQYIFISSARVYTNSELPVREEDTPRLLDSCNNLEYLATDEYALSKARQEDALRNCDKHNWTIIRPYITYSEKRLQLGVLEKETWLWRALHGRTIVFSKDIAEKVTTLTYGLNVSEAISALIGKRDVLGETFHITCNTSCRWSDILDIYLDTMEVLLGKRPKVLMIENALNLTTNGKWQVMDRLFNRSFNNEKINKYFNTNDFLPVKDGLSKCLRAFIKHPHFDYVLPRREAYYDRLTGEWARKSDFAETKSWIKYIIFRTIYPKKHLI